MSELIAEARVLVTPDTTQFRRLLDAELTAITSKPVVIPVTAAVTNVAGAGGTTVLAAAQDDLAASTTLAADAAIGQAAAISTVNTAETINTEKMVEGATASRGSAAARNEDAAAAARQARALSGLGRGAGSAGASLLGVRGATLAATGPFIAGAAGAIAFTKAIQTFTSFNQELSVFAATTGATADEISRVSESAKQLGKDITLPGASAQDAAESMTEFAKAGLSVNDAIRAARGGLQLATAAQLSNADAVEITANALNAFKLSGDQAVVVADTLANAANAAQGSIADVGLGLKQAAGAAAVVGVSFKDTTALLTLLAKNGLTASDAGTSLRTAFIRLVNPSKQAQTILKELNINLRDAQGNLRPEVFAEFAQAQQGLARSTQDANAAIVFGQDAFRAFGVLSREGTEGLNDTRKSLDQTGTAAKVAGARMVGLAGDVENLKNELSAFGIQLGAIGSQLAGPIVRGTTHFVQSLETISTKIGNFVDPKGFTAAEHGFDSLADHADKLNRALTLDADPFFSPQLTSDLNETLDELTKKSNELVRQGFLTRFLETFKTISPEVKKAMQDNIITPTEQAQLETTKLGRVFLEALPHTAQFFQNFGVSAESGIEAARAALADGGPKMAEGLRLGLEDAGAKAKADAARVGTEIGNEVTDSIAASAARIQGLIADAFTAKRTQDRLRAGKAASALIDIEFQGGSLQQQIAGLKKLLAQQDELVSDLVGDPNAKQSKIDQAKVDATTTQNKINGLQDQINSAARAATAKAVADAQKRARDAQTAAAKVKAANDAAFLQSQEDARDRKDRLISLAGDTPALIDDIRRQEQLQALVKKQIVALKASAVDEEQKADALRALRRVRDATTDELKRLREAQKKNQAEQKAQAQETIADNLALRTQIAEARDAGTNAIVRRVDDEIKQAQKIQSGAKRGSKAWLEATLRLEELRQKRRELLKKADEATKEAAAGFGSFEFLQKQQGFAANLLGNLIPGFATAGLVGNTSSAAAFQPRIEDPRTAMLGDDVLTGNRLNADRGVRPVQVDTTNMLLRQILRTLNGKANNPPEIQQNWRTAFAELDTL